MPNSYKHTDKRAHIPSKEEVGYESANYQVKKGKGQREFIKIANDIRDIRNQLVSKIDGIRLGQSEMAN